MKLIKAFAVVTKNSELSDVIKTSLNGVLVPFFDQESEAEEWRTRHPELSTRIARVELRELTSRKEQG